VTSQIVVILDAYNDFRNIIQNLSIPYYTLIGNHDHREIFCEVFPHEPRDEHGFVQQMLKLQLDVSCCWTLCNMGEIGEFIVKSEQRGSGLNWNP